MSNVKKQNLKFDEKRVIALLKSIIPEQLQVNREKRIVFEIVSTWRKGKLTRLTIDGSEVLHLTDQSKTEENILTILRLTHDYRYNLSGRIIFEVTKERGEMVCLFVAYKHKSFDNRTNNIFTTK